MRVLELQAVDNPAWDDYVWNATQALPYHLIGWKGVMERTYGHRPHYLLAKDGGRIEGVMPLFEVRSKILGDSLTTLPGGLCADSQKAGEALVERAKEMTRELGVNYLAIRDSRDAWNGGLVSVERHCTTIRDLPADAEVLWRNLDKRLRRHVRIAFESDLETQVGGEEYLNDFYRVLSAFLRERGTPVFGRAFLHHVAEAFGDHHLIVCLWWQGKLIGAYSAFLFRDTIYGAWGGSLHKYFDRRPNHMLYWRYMQYGCQHGFKHIDLGRSTRGSGQYQFKKAWGAEPRPLYQLYFINSGAAVPDITAHSESDYRYRLFTRVWRKLPLRVTQWMGAKIRRHLPFG